MSNEKSAGHAAHIESLQKRGFKEKVDRPLKVVFLGAGSVFFNKLFSDVMNIPGADSGEMVLVDIDEERLEFSFQAGQKILNIMGKGWKLRAETDRLKALENADYIINCIEVSGTECVKWDNDIPLKYGVDQCIGDTIGPGGLMKALRTVPVFIEVLKDIEKLCPNAPVLNYTNPMSILCLAAARASKAKVLGLCHGVQAGIKQLAEYTNTPYHELKWKCGGVNHLAWFTELSHNGKDLYPGLKEKVRNDDELLAKDPVRFDVMEHFGYFLTESSGHLSEYIPYYRKRSGLIKKHCGEGYLGESGFYARNWPEWRTRNDEKRKRFIAGDEDFDIRRSSEYASYIIEAMETNKPISANINVPNTGLIENLPQDGIVEVACLIDRNGVSPTHFGPLPAQCAALCDSQMRMFELATTACIENSREAAIHALMVDPLTAAVCSPGEIRQMAEELFKAEKDYIRI